MELKMMFKSRWRWWALLIAAILLLAAGFYFWRWGQARIYGTGVPDFPRDEMAVVNNVADKLKNAAKQAQNERNRLPEVIEGAKNVVRRDVGRLDDDGVVCRWNGLLGRYREDRAAAEGVRSDE